MTKTKRKHKWTQELRRIVYSRIVMQFGSHFEWGKYDHPKGLHAEYQQALQEIANYLTLLTNEKFEDTAVEAQIQFGLTPQPAIKSRGLVKNWIMNKAAALESGFLKSSDLPKLLECHK